MSEAEKKELNPETLSTAFLKCRTLGHSWSVSGVFDDTGSARRLVLHCLSCKAKRTDIVSATGKSRGKLLGRWYDYTEGYIQKDRKAPNRVVFRYEMVRRVR